MAISDKWTRLQIRQAVQRELMDTSAKWWTTGELDSYVGQAQDRLQDEMELVWGTATATTTLGTLTLSAVATDILRLDAVYWNGVRLGYKTKLELDAFRREWRGAPTNAPTVYYQDDPVTVSFYPSPSTAGTAVFEYPKVLAFSTDTSPMTLPAWTKYGLIDYAVHRAHARHGPNQSASLASRARARWLEKLDRYQRMKDAVQPDKFLSLRPTTHYEKDLLQPDRTTR